MRPARWMYKLPLRLRTLFRRNIIERELDDELQYHLDRQIEANIARGMDAREARYAAMRSMGGIDRHKETARDTRGVGVIERIAQDLRLGLRVSLKSPGFAFAVIATLALGIGATTAVFSVVYGVVLQPLPYPDAGRLVNVWTSNAAGMRFGASTGNYVDWRAGNTVFEEIGIIKLVANFNITGDGEPERVLGGRSSASLFRVLGTKPMLGRWFTEEDGPAEDKVLLSYGLWKRRYGSDPGILGKTIQLNGAPYTVLGVMPPGFQFRNREFALWTPLMIDPEESRATFDQAAVARLKPGVTLAQAEAQMSAIQSQLANTYPVIQGTGVQIAPVLDDLVGNVRTQLYVLMGAVLCLLLIGCANLANLLVARSMARRRELVVRAALGANKGRLIVQSIMEVVPLVALGGASGLFLARWMLSFLIPLLPSTMPRVEAIRIDWIVLAFAAFLLIAIAIATGIWPALQVMRWNVAASLRDSGRTNTTGGSTARLRDILVTSQVAAVIVLMVVSALLIRSFVALKTVNPGFRTDRILSAQLAVSRAKYVRGIDVVRYTKRIEERVASLPGVISAGLVNRLPLAGGTQTGALEFEGLEPAPATSGIGNGPAGFDWRTVTPDYFRTLGIPLLQGRFFNSSDTPDRPAVGIVDERVASLVWPNENPIGKRFRIGFPGQPWIEVVGVVGHIRHDGLGIDQRPQVYWNYQHRAQDRLALAVRTDQDLQQFARTVISAIHEIDPEQPVYDVRPMTEVAEQSLSPQWLTTMLLSLFASVALLLAAIGVYGVLSYSVGMRVREIGIRMALGSRPAGIVWMVLRHGSRLAGFGIAIGLAGALMVSRIVGSLLFGIQPTDITSFAAASIALLVVALAACYIPARRAASVDPLSVLRAE